MEARRREAESIGHIGVTSYQRCDAGRSHRGDRLGDKADDAVCYRHGDPLQPLVSGAEGAAHAADALRVSDPVERAEDHAADDRPFAAVESLQVIEPQSLEVATAGGEPEPSGLVFLDLPDCVIDETGGRGQPPGRRASAVTHESPFTADPEAPLGIAAKHDRPPPRHVGRSQDLASAAVGTDSFDAAALDRREHRAIGLRCQADHDGLCGTVIRDDRLERIGRLIMDCQAVGRRRPDAASRIAGERVDITELAERFGGFRDLRHPAILDAKNEVVLRAHPDPSRRILEDRRGHRRARERADRPHVPRADRGEGRHDSGTTHQQRSVRTLECRTAIGDRLHVKHGASHSEQAAEAGGPDATLRVANDCTGSQREAG